MAPVFAVPLLGKLGIALKGLMGGKAAAAGAAKGGALVKALGAAKGAGAGAKAGFFGNAKRFAGQAFRDYMGPGGVTPTNIAMNFGPDAFFGAVQGAMTPGDLGDKLIAGTTTAVGGALGGVGAVGMLGKHKNNPGLRMMGEFGGGYGGDMLGQMVGDSVLRAKGGGTTPWEKLQQEGDQQYREQIEREVLAAYGIGGYQPTDIIRDKLLGLGA